MVPPTARSVRLEWATTSAVESHPRLNRLTGRRGCCSGWVRTDYSGRRAIRSCGDGWM